MMSPDTRISAPLDQPGCRPGCVTHAIDSCFRLERDQPLPRMVWDLAFCVAGDARGGATAFEGRELIRQLDELGSKSLPLVALAVPLSAPSLPGKPEQSGSIRRQSMLPAALVYSIIHETVLS